MTHRLAVPKTRALCARCAHNFRMSHPFFRWCMPVRVYELYTRAPHPHHKYVIFPNYTQINQFTFGVWKRINTHWIYIYQKVWMASLFAALVLMAGVSKWIKFFFLFACVVSSMQCAESARRQATHSRRRPRHPFPKWNGMNGWMKTARGCIYISFIILVCV